MQMGFFSANILNFLWTWELFLPNVIENFLWENVINLNSPFSIDKTHETNETNETHDKVTNIVHMDTDLSRELRRQYKMWVSQEE